MKKFLIILAILIAIVLTVGYVFRTPLMMYVVGTQIAPEDDFNLATVPTPADYANNDAWAALPTFTDPGDQLPAGITRLPTGVAVFFVHPTSYLNKASWNQPLDDETANWLVDERILRHQASVFNGCCDIYAPRYRQATFYSFFDQSGNGEKALDLAYGDVIDAFDNFISRIEPSQPFIIAGHSQGTRHATELLADKIAGTPLMERMVAAYLVGFSISHDQLGDVPACENASQTGCAIGWNAMDGEGAGAFGTTERLLCTNPLTWEVNNEYAGHELNTGAIGYPVYGPAEEGEDVTAMPIEVGIADAKCFEGQLAIPNLKSTAFPGRMLGNSMHVYDYSLFHMNIRANVSARISTFLADNPAPLANES